MITHKEYVRLMAMALSGDPEKLAEANAVLYGKLVADDLSPRSPMPSMALLDIEAAINT